MERKIGLKFCYKQLLN